MKNNWKLLYNPFDRIAGWKAFLAGLPIVCATVVLGWLTDTVAYGLEVKTGGGISLEKDFIFTGVGLACTVIIMYVVGLIFSKGVRFQDILGTVTLARAPYILSPLVGLLADPDLDIQMEEMMQTGNMGAINWSSILFISLFAIVVSVWAVALLYHAFRTSTGLKGGKCAGLFIFSLIASEVVMLCILW